MELGWIQSGLYGFVAGLAEILPISARAHELLLLKFLGIQTNLDLLNLMCHLGVIAGLYFCSQSQIVRMNRARALARVPKRRRKRPLDTKSLMDWSMLKTMLLPAIAGLLLYRYTRPLEKKSALLAVFLLLNGLILYIPQFFPSSNRDSRNLTRVEGALMGLGGTAAVLPGVSAIGASLSIGSICGVERSYGLTMAMLMDMGLMMGFGLGGTAAVLPGVSAIGASLSIGSICGVERSYGLTMAMLMDMGLMMGFVVYDVLGLFSGGLDGLTFVMVVQCLLGAGAAFGGTLLGVKVLRFLAQDHGYGLFGLYSFGLALFTFVLNLMA